MKIHPHLANLIFACAILILLSACNSNPPAMTGMPTQGMVMTESVTASPEPSDTPVPPTATPVPLAAIVNGEGITLAEFQAELLRYQATEGITGTILASDPDTVVMNELIDQTLLAQGAAEFGYIVDETRLQEKIDALIDQLGGAQALEEWKAEHGYSDDDFEQALKRSMGAAWMRDQITSQVPEMAEQVHVMQILVQEAAEAEEAYNLLESGRDFSELAALYDPLTSGDLGWFPRHYIELAVIEEAAFALQPGQYSEVIQTELGYHILYLVERKADALLQPDAHIALKVKALLDWLNERQNQSEIQILVP